MRPSFVLLSSLVAKSGRLVYQHGHHAGSYADVVKHSTLILLLQHMKKKKSPFTYVETHAGPGFYPLLPALSDSGRPPEHERGIDVLTKHNNIDEELLPAPTSDLLDLVKNLSEKGTDYNTTYPGSPWIAASLCRAFDSLLFCENALDQFELLKSNLANDPRASLLHENGYKALTRPENVDSQKRALIFMDPPYQTGSDTDQIASLVSTLQKHWRAARIVIWYPVSEENQKRTLRLHDAVLASTLHDSECLACELDSGTNDVGSGMLMVNPPYMMDEEVRELLPRLGQVLKSSARETTPDMRVKWLTHRD